MSIKNREKSDNYYYQWITFGHDTFMFLLKSVKYYINMIQKDISEIEKDEDLKDLLKEDSRKNLWKLVVYFLYISSFSCSDNKDSVTSWLSILNLL